MSSDSSWSGSWWEPVILATFSTFSALASDFASDSKLWLSKAIPSFLPLQEPRHVTTTEDAGTASVIPMSTVDSPTVTVTVTATVLQAASSLFKPAHTSSIAFEPGRDTQLSYQDPIAILIPVFSLLCSLCYLWWRRCKYQRRPATTPRSAESHLPNHSRSILDQLVIATTLRLHEIRGHERGDFISTPRIELREGVTATVRGLADIILVAEDQELLQRINELELENDRLKQQHERRRSSTSNTQAVQPTSGVKRSECERGSSADTNSDQSPFPPTQTARSLAAASLSRSSAGHTDSSPENDMLNHYSDTGSPKVNNDTRYTPLTRAAGGPVAQSQLSPAQQNLHVIGSTPSVDESTRPDLEAGLFDPDGSAEILFQIAGAVQGDEANASVQTAGDQERDIFRKQRDNARAMFAPRSQAPNWAGKGR